jgi:hypothetical protein
MTTTLETTVELGTLTKTDIVALRQCDRAIFKTDRNSTQGLIRCVKKTKTKGPFDDGEREHTIDCEARGTVYGQDGLADCKSLRDTGRRAFALLHNYKHDAHTFGTFAALVRPGDAIRLKWCGSGSNQYEKNAGLHHDSLTVEVKRGKHRFAFLLDSCVCPDNSARMISN